MSKDNRGPAPSALTKYQLCSRAAGRCQFCNKELFVDPFTLEDNNNSNLAHIIASSPDGPRGDAVRSHQLSDKIENLMLMCLEHHHLIDQNEDFYTEEVLLRMKEEHENRVRELTETITISETEMILFSAKIKNRDSVSILPKETVKAFIGHKKPVTTTGIKIEPTDINDYHSNEYWKKQTNNVIYLYNTKVSAFAEYNPNISFSVFPLAPIPLIAFLGYIMGDKVSDEVYQKFREPDTWKWQSADVTNTFECRKREIKKGENIALVLSLTNEIVEDRVAKAYDVDTIYSIQANRLGVDCIQSDIDLSKFWHAYQEICDQIKREYPNIEEVSVFPAIPASAAFEIGRRYMKGVYPKLKFYDEDNGFFETIVIGER